MSDMIQWMDPHFTDIHEKLEMLWSKAIWHTLTWQELEGFKDWLDSTLEQHSNETETYSD